MLPSSTANILDWLRSVMTLLSILWSVANGSPWFHCTGACARCRRQVAPMEELVLQFYPGLFSPSPPSAQHAVSDSQSANFVYSTSAEVPTALAGNTSSNDHFHSIQHTINSKESPGKNSSQHSKSKHQKQANKESKMTIDGTYSTAGPSCCQTEVEYLTPPNVTVEGRVYQVVHLRHAFQFIPVGRCRSGSTCSYGECVERYRAHWVLLYNDTQPLTGPPVSFAPVEVPSHCDCVNVGKS